MPFSKGAALVTGGAQRLGAAIALALARRGFDIALHYRTAQEAATTVAGEIESAGSRCHLLRCDLNDEADTSTLIERAATSLPALNLLVNNASVFEQGRLVETDTELFERHFNVNLKAPFLLVRDFARSNRTGHVINMLDARIAKHDGSHMAYTLSKKALFEFTKMAARELGPAIRVNSVSPGLILPPVKKGADYLREKSGHIPLKCAGSPSHVISSILYLVDNPFVTGECLFVDGGEHL